MSRSHWVRTERSDVINTRIARCRERRGIDNSEQKKTYAYPQGSSYAS